MAQGSDEPLSQFVGRFTSQVQGIPDLHPSLAIQAFLTGLKPSRFFWSLIERPPTTLPEMLQRAHQYVAVETLIAGKQDETKRSRGEQSRGHLAPPPKRREDRSGLLPARPPPIPLNSTRTEIFFQIQEKELLKTPSPMKSHPERRDKRRYCRFHREYGHDTEECRDLHYQIEDLIRRGHLRRYVREQPPLPDGRPSRDLSPRPQGPIEKQIDVIFGGPVSSGNSSSARKAYARSEAGKRPLHHEDLDATFRSEDKEHSSHDDALVISIRMANAYVKRVMIDTGSSADILYFDAFQQLGLTDLDLTPLTSTLTGFTGDSISPMGTTTIPVTFGGEPRSKTLLVSFMVVKLPSAYNAIIGRPTLNRLRAVVSTYHRVLTFLTRAGVGEVKSDTRESRQCYLTTIMLCKRPRTEPFGAMPPGPEENTRDTRSAERVLELSLDPNRPDKLVKVGSELAGNQQVQLIDFLRKNDDVFAWTPNDMSGVDPEIAQHYLNISPDARSVKQRPCKFTPDRQKAIEDEVTRLLDAQLIEEVKYPTWLSNVVLVKKANGNWRMCIDYTDLNRACPKDCYPLPRIDQLVDATSGHQLLSFMDTFSGYNQIQMAPRDKRNTAFITHNETYCYKVMPFGLKNVGATYQRLVNRMFKDQVGRNMEIYIDDMIVKSRHAETHLSNLEETFRTLRKYKMRLNPTKCTFGITSGKFLGFIVHQRRIDANPDKIKAIQEMQPPRSIKEVKRLTGRLAALSRFISRAGDKSSTFFRALKSAKGFKWTPECEEAFRQLKSHIENLPQLASLKDGEPLSLYLAATDLAVSSVLVTLDKAGEKLIYYTSHVLAGPELRYAPIERIALALILASRKLRPYFQTHPIKVITDQPLPQILSKFDVAGRMLKWSVELGEFDIEYEPRKTIKDQVLADFLSELAPPEVLENPNPG
ncbi:hypothetical protein OPV22_027290 [Ensete ventricosum]|uniref:Reverse transcriptase domain-containing protein n=1 Tax=Ensete ventricosum TaxID=4639 RepID=A0AAV8PUW8_ENSVE|nr:hypothetical protein OPV22_027290 [Ensete ventricosum]